MRNLMKAEEQYRIERAEREEKEWIEKNKWSSSNPKPAVKPAPKVDKSRLSEEMQHGDSREASEKLEAKLEAAKNSEIGSMLRQNMARGAAKAAQEIGIEIELPNDDDETEKVIETLEALFAKNDDLETESNEAKESSLKSAFQVIGLPTPPVAIKQVIGLDSEQKTQIADAILNKMFIFRKEEITWDLYFKEAPYTLPGIEGKETLEAMKTIHRILVQVS